MTPRIQTLAEGIKHRLIAIQKSQQIYKKFSKLEKKNLRLTESQIGEVAERIALDIDNWYTIRTKQGNQPLPHEARNYLERELKEYSE